MHQLVHPLGTRSPLESKERGLDFSRITRTVALHPRRGDQGSSTALCGQRFVWGGVHVQTPTFKLVGNRVSAGLQ